MTIALHPGHGSFLVPVGVALVFPAFHRSLTGLFGDALGVKARRAAARSADGR